MKVIGIDIGGSHISGSEIQLQDGILVTSQIFEAKVDTSLGADEIISTWSGLISQIAGGDTEIKLGIAFPGPFDYENGISLIEEQGKMKSLLGLSVKNLLAEKLDIPQENIQFVNDAEAFLLGEKFGGVLKGHDKIMGITLGTGLGSAIGLEDVVKDAKLWTAPFRDGIAEDYLGNAWFVQEAKSRFGIQISGVKEILTWPDSSMKESIFDDFARSLGEFLLPYLIRIQAEALVLGGKVSLAHQHFLPKTLEFLRKFGSETEIKISKLGEEAALIGAALPFYADKIYAQT